jgi:hypothetical protein
VQHPRLFPLARLELRRSLAPALLITLVVLAALLLASNRGASLTGLEPDPAVLRGQARLLLWSFSLLVLVPAAIGRAASSGTWHARREAPWLGPRAIGQAPVALATWAGQLAALAILLAFVWVAGEWGAAHADRWGSPGGDLPAGSRTTLEERGRASAVPRGLLSPGDRTSWVAADSASLDQFHLRASLVAGGDTDKNGARLSLVTRRPGAAAFAMATETLLTAEATLVWTAPPGGGSLEIVLTNEGPATLVIGGPGGLTHWRPTPTDRRGPRTLLLLWLLALAPALALAQGLGFWMSPASATLAVLCLGLVAVSSAGGAAPMMSWAPWPGADLARAMAIIGEGRSPARPDTIALAIAAFWTLPGLLLARGRRP